MKKGRCERKEVREERRGGRYGGRYRRIVGGGVRQQAKEWQCVDRFVRFGVEILISRPE